MTMSAFEEQENFENKRSSIIDWTNGAISQVEESLSVDKIAKGDIPDNVVQGLGKFIPIGTIKVLVSKVYEVQRNLLNDHKTFLENAEFGNETHLKAMSDLFSQIDGTTGPSNPFKTPLISSYPLSVLTGIEEDTTTQLVYSQRVVDDVLSILFVVKPNEYLSADLKLPQPEKGEEAIKTMINGAAVVWADVMRKISSGDDSLDPGEVIDRGEEVIRGIYRSQVGPQLDEAYQARLSYTSEFYTAIGQLITSIAGIYTDDVHLNCLSSNIITAVSLLKPPIVEP